MSNFDRFVCAYNPENDAVTRVTALEMELIQTVIKQSELIEKLQKRVDLLEERIEQVNDMVYTYL